MRVAAALAFLVLPLAIAPSVSFYYDVVPKTVVLLIAAAAVLVAAASKGATLSGLLSRRGPLLYAALLCASMLIAMLSAVVSSHPTLAWQGSNWRQFGAITQIAVICVSLLLADYAARAPERRFMFLRAVTLAGIAAGMYGVLQYFGWDPFLNNDAYRVGEGPFRIVRPPGTLGHSDYYSAWLLWPVFWGIALAQSDGSAAWRAVAAGAVGIASVAILLSGSRGSLVGLAVGLCIIAVLRRPNLRLTAAAIAVVLCATALFYISPAGAQLRARAHWISDEPLGGARLLLWGDSLKMAKTRPVLGFGPDTFVADFPQFQSVPLARAYPDFYHESPHNMFLDSLTSEGLLGLLLLLAIVAAGISGGIRAVSGANAHLAVPLLASVAAAVAAHQFAALTIPSAVCLYTVVGVLVLLADSPVAAVSWTLPRVPITVLYAAAALLFAGYGACLAISDHRIAVAKRALETGDIQAANDAYFASRRFGRLGVSADLELSRRSAARAAAAADTLSKLRYAAFAAVTGQVATKSAEQQANAWYNMAALAATRNDAGTVEASLRTAIHCAPNWFKPHWALARVYQLTGRGQDAAREARIAAELDANKHSEVTSSVAALLHSVSIEK